MEKEMQHRIDLTIKIAVTTDSEHQPSAHVEDIISTTRRLFSVAEVDLVSAEVTEAAGPTAPFALQPQTAL